jgi:Ca-activated chloride channel family protein
LLNQIRLHGENPELVQAVVDLSVKFGVVTPYTSYLITEDDILSQAGRDRVAREVLRGGRSVAEGGTSIADASGGDTFAIFDDDEASASGAKAVGRAQAANALEQAEAAAPLPTGVPVQGGAADPRVGGATRDAASAEPAPVAAEVVQIVGAKTFVLQEGVWIDTGFDATTMETAKVPFASDEYFRLLDERPELAEAFALGNRVIVLIDDVAYEVTE